MDVCCFRCNHVFEVAGEPDDMWVCGDCRDAADESSEAHRFERWHGGNGPQSDREREQVTR